MVDVGSTFFEITTAMGLLYFARRDVQAVVLEVGMGGRLDSTNVVHPVLSIITSISFDHTRQLGNTLASIATEKAGILKRGRPGRERGTRRRGASGHSPRGSTAPFAAARARHGLLVRRHPAGAPCNPPHHGVRPARTWRTDWESFACRCSVLTRRTTRRSPWRGSICWPSLQPSLAVTRDDVVRGFAALRWPARVEVLGQDPWLVIDGAHNAASAAALAETLRTCFPPARAP